MQLIYRTFGEFCVVTQSTMKKPGAQSTRAYRETSLWIYLLLKSSLSTYTNIPSTTFGWQLLLLDKDWRAFPCLYERWRIVRYIIFLQIFERCWVVCFLSSGSTFLRLCNCYNGWGILPFYVMPACPLFSVGYFNIDTNRKIKADFFKN